MASGTHRPIDDMMRRLEEALGTTVQASESSLSTITTSYVPSQSSMSWGQRKKRPRSDQPDQPEPDPLEWPDIEWINRNKESWKTFYGTVQKGCTDQLTACCRSVHGQKQRFMNCHKGQGLLTPNVGGSTLYLSETVCRQIQAKSATLDRMIELMFD